MTSSDDSALMTAALLVLNFKRSRGYCYDVTDFLSPRHKRIELRCLKHYEKRDKIENLITLFEAD